MLEDEQLRQLLLVNGVCDTATITRLGAEATRSNRTLYDMVVARGVVPEAQLIQMVGAVLGVGAVLLKDFQGDAMLMSLAPVDLLKREGMLPVGIQEVEGRRSLIVTSANGNNVPSLPRGCHIGTVVASCYRNGEMSCFGPVVKGSVCVFYVRICLKANA